MPDEPAMSDPSDAPDPSGAQAASEPTAAPAALDTAETPDAPRLRPTWAQQLAVERAPRSMRLQADFAGLRAGTLLFVPTPRLVDGYLRTVPHGTTTTMARMREDLARTHGCEAACPVSTAIFLRMVAEAAWEQIGTGRPAAEVAPFWRVVAPDSPVGRRLTVDAEWIRGQRALEAQPAPLSPARGP